MSQKLVSGFTFIKNGLSLGYPIRESIESIEPLCDEVIINVGFDNPELKNDDGTYQYLRDTLTHSKFKFITSYWDPKMTSEGLILSQQTNIALDACQGKYCQYIQGDEVIHEEDLAAIHNAILDLENSSHIHGLVFDYVHFYGNVDVVKHTRNTYRREVRLIRNFMNIRSHLDAQGFRHQNGDKLLCKRVNARIFHYGWARQEKVMGTKIKAMDKLYHGENFNRYQENKFNYHKVWGLKKFQATHPLLMKNWIEQNRNDIDVMNLQYIFNPADISLAISDWVESITGLRIGEYRNYRLF